MPPNASAANMSLLRQDILPMFASSTPLRYCPDVPRPLSLCCKTVFLAQRQRRHAPPLAARYKQQIYTHVHNSRRRRTTSPFLPATFCLPPADEPFYRWCSMRTVLSARARQSCRRPRYSEVRRHVAGGRGLRAALCYRLVDAQRAAPRRAPQARQPRPAAAFFSAARATEPVSPEEEFCGRYRTRGTVLV